MPQLSVQNPNQFSQAPVHGMPDMRVNQNSFFVRIDPESETETFPVGTPLKLIAGTSNEILVDAAETTDTPFGVIPYSLKKNVWLPGDTVQIYGAGSVLYLMVSAAISRGAGVQFDPSTNKVATLTDNHAQLGICLDQPTTNGQVARIQIAPVAEVVAS